MAALNRDHTSQFHNALRRTTDGVMVIEIVRFVRAMVRISLAELRNSSVLQKDLPAHPSTLIVATDPFGQNLRC